MHPLLKGLKDIKSFWESDHSMQRKACIVKLLYKHWWHVFTHLLNLERAGFICGTLSALAMQVINTTKQGDVLPQHSCQASLIFSSPI